MKNMNESSDSKAVSVKHDQGKPRLGLIPVRAQIPIARVFEHGALKYGEYNYLKGGFTNMRLIDAILRHINAYMGGEDLDPESKIFHMAHAAAGCMILLENELTGSLKDARAFTSSDDAS